MTGPKLYRTRSFSGRAVSIDVDYEGHVMIDRPADDGNTYVLTPRAQATLRKALRRARRIRRERGGSC